MAQAEKEDLYVLLFQSAYKSASSGGNFLAEKLKRSELPHDAPPISEALEICTNEQYDSVVTNGPLQGRTLSSLLEEYASMLAGTKYVSGPFPLEVKIINAQKKLPLQVQPSPESVSSVPGAVPGAKFWYILSSEKGAKIMAGIQAASSRMRFMEDLRSNKAESQMQLFDAFANDAYYIPGGRLHSIGAGNLILEISKASASTYTLENRSSTPEEQQNLRETLACVDFMDRTVSRITGASDVVARNRKFPVINRCSYFQAEELLLVSEWHDNTNHGESFHILSAVQGGFSVIYENSSVTVPEGRSCLVPACCGSYIISPEPGEHTQCRIIKTSL